MSEETQEQTTTTQSVARLSDTSIGMIRDLVQLSLLLGVNIIDNLRAMRFDVDQTGALLPSAAYVTAYNEMLVNLEKQAQAVLDQAQKQREEATLAVEEAVVVTASSSDDSN